MRRLNVSGLLFVSTIGLLGHVRMYSQTDLQATVDDPMGQEDQICRLLYEATTQDDVVRQEVAINRPALLKGLGSAPATSVARRAAIVCSWLSNDGRSDRAAILARTTLTLLSSSRTADLVERQQQLYWEAVLCWQFLSDKDSAMERIAAIRRLGAITDPVADLELQILSGPKRVNE